MKYCYISYSKDATPTDVIRSLNATELDFKALNNRAIAEGKGEIRVIEFRFEGQTIGTVLF